MRKLTVAAPAMTTTTTTAAMICIHSAIVAEHNGAADSFSVCRRSSTQPLGSADATAMDCSAIGSQFSMLLSLVVLFAPADCRRPVRIFSKRKTRNAVRWVGTAHFSSAARHNSHFASVWCVCVCEKRIRPERRTAWLDWTVHRVCISNSNQTYGEM